jgi:hypothetical protein
MSDLPEDGHRQFLLLARLFQAELGKSLSKNDFIVTSCVLGLNKIIANLILCYI